MKNIQTNNKTYLLKIFIKDIYSRFGILTILLVVLMTVVGLMEGIVYVLLFPLLNLIGIETATSLNIFTKFFNQASQSLRIQPTLLHVLSIIILVALVQYIIFILQSWLAADLQHRYVAVWRKELFSNYLSANWKFFLKSKQSDFINNIIFESSRLGGAFYVVSQATSIIIIAIVYLLLSLVISWQIALMTLGLTLVFYPLSRKFISYGHKLGEKINEINARLQFESQEYFSGAKTIKATVSEQEVIARFSTTINNCRNLFFKGSFMPNLMLGISKFMGVIILAVILFICFKILNINIASVAVIFVIFFRFVPRLYSLQENISLLFVHLPAISVLRESEREAILNQEIRIEKHFSEGIFSRSRGIDIKNLSFSYSQGIATLSGINIGISFGKTIAIVGSSGSGKSTLVDCLLRLLEPTAGNIYIDGINANEIPLQAWRENIGYVSQDTFLFNGTIRNNILWGNFTASEKDIMEVAKLAGAHNFIAKLPAGYDTVVGDRGIRLSGGERQRIGLARALISKPKLLLLDEPTSNLDSESEKYVQESIENLFGKVTIVIVAHRFSTVRNADYIYVLENSKIVEQGKIEDLLKLEGRFKYLWDLQKK